MSICRRGQASLHIDEHLLYGEGMSDLSDRLKVLADPTRLAILSFLSDPIQNCCSRDDGVCNCDLETFLGVKQPTVSHHMKQLVEAGFVTSEKRGRWVYYELKPDIFHEVAAALEAFAKAGDLAQAEKALV